MVLRFKFFSKYVFKPQVQVQTCHSILCPLSMGCTAQVLAHSTFLPTHTLHCYHQKHNTKHFGNSCKLWQLLDIIFCCRDQTSQSSTIQPATRARRSVRISKIQTESEDKNVRRSTRKVSSRKSDR